MLATKIILPVVKKFLLLLLSLFASSSLITYIRFCSFCFLSVCCCTTYIVQILHFYLDWILQPLKCSVPLWSDASVCSPFTLLVFKLCDRGCHVDRAEDPYGCTLDFLDRSYYFFFQVAPQLHSRGYVDPIPVPLTLRKSGSAGNRTQTSGSVAIGSRRRSLCDLRI
jgi:hypothetical protein